MSDPLRDPALKRAPMIPLAPLEAHEELCCIEEGPCVGMRAVLSLEECEAEPGTFAFCVVAHEVDADGKPTGLVSAPAKHGGSLRALSQESVSLGDLVELKKDHALTALARAKAVSQAIAALPMKRIVAPAEPFDAEAVGP